MVKCVKIIMTLRIIIIIIIIMTTTIIIVKNNNEIQTFVQKVPF